MDETVSRRQAELKIHDGKLKIRDRSSRFGTLVNLKRNTRFNSIDGITLQFESMVFEIKK